MLVLGGGPGGYSAAFRAADLGLKVVIVERYATLGGVCLNVGCIPSKALLHVAAVMDEVNHFADLGVTFGKPEVDLKKLLAHKNKVVGKLTNGLSAMAKMRKVTVVQGSGEFADPFHLKVVLAKDGSTQTIKFKQAIIAAGSEAVKLPFLPKDDPRIVTSTGALELRQRPKRMLVIGGGIIGLEMGTVYSTLGAKLDVVEMLDGLMQGADRDLVKVWQKLNAPRFDKLMLKTKTVGAEATKDGIREMVCAATPVNSARASSPRNEPQAGVPWPSIRRPSWTAAGMSVGSDRLSPRSRPTTSSALYTNGASRLRQESPCSSPAQVRSRSW